MTALNKAYATNTETPLDTLEFAHSSINGGALRLVKAFYDLTATLEDSTDATFTAAAFEVNLPNRSTDGAQELSIQVPNISNNVYLQLRAAQVAMRSSNERIIVKHRQYLESDLSSPASGVTELVVTSSSINTHSATIRATWLPFPDVTYPRKRYYPSIYPGVKYLL